jgi:PAS domain S-box-containing protein
LAPRPNAVPEGEHMFNAPTDYSSVDSPHATDRIACDLASTSFPPTLESATPLATPHFLANAYRQVPPSAPTVSKTKSTGDSWSGASEWEAANWEERYQRLVRKVPDAIFLLSAAGNIIALNPAFEAITGWPRKEWLGKSILGPIEPDDVPLVLAALSRAARGEVVPLFEARFRHRSGSARLLEWLIAFEATDAGVPAILGIARDITGRRETELALQRMQEQLRHAQKMDALGRLAGGVAHDFNNVLTSILGCGQLLLGSIPQGSPDGALVAEMVKAGERAATLTRQLLSFSRKEEWRPQVIDLNAVVSGLQDMLRRLLGEQVKLRTELAPGLGHIKVDAGQIEHVIVNLALNARDAMPAGGTILVRTANVVFDGQAAQECPELEPGSYVSLALTDTGIGMDEETKARLFEPFFTTKAPGKGTGLGLATAYGVVKQANGSIRIKSERGHGTTVTIVFPQSKENLTATMLRQESPSPAAAAATVLVVEDDVSVRTLACHVLRFAGYVVLEAGGADEAVRLCERSKGNIDLLLSDIGMPDVPGNELANRLTHLRAEMRVLLMSGYPDTEAVRKSVLAARVAFLQKPFLPSDLLRAVHAILEQSGPMPGTAASVVCPTARLSFAKSGVTDAMWERMQPILSSPRPDGGRARGRKPLDDRKILSGILHILKTGISWKKLPREFGCGSGATCQNYLKAWQRADVWPKLLAILLQELPEADKIDWSRADFDRDKNPISETAEVQSIGLDRASRAFCKCSPLDEPESSCDHTFARQDPTPLGTVEGNGVP